MIPQSLSQMFSDVQAKVKTAPSDLVARSSLWQIFAARGEYERARQQLDMMLRLDASWAMEVQGCHSLLDAEILRTRVFEGQDGPTFLGEPPGWFGLVTAALPLVHAGEHEAAAALLNQAMESAEPTRGSWNGEAFEWIADGDSRLGPCMEVIAQGRYVWMEIRSVVKLVCEPPRELRDLVWQPAKLEIDDVGALDVFLPVRYPGATTDEHMLARQTDWLEPVSGLFLGQGQKSFTTDAETYGVLDLRELRMTPSA